jgi:hypothetical protein
VTDEASAAQFKKEAEAAAKRLSDFAREYAGKNAWETWSAARLAARLYLEAGKPNDAAGMYAFLGKLTGLSAELKYEARLGEVEMVFRGGNSLAVSGLLAEVEKAGPPPPGTGKEKLAILQAVVAAAGQKKAKTAPTAAVTAVEKILNQATDPTVRAYGFNLLGELYLQCDLPRNALWALLRVELVDRQDPEEVVKAVVRLIDVFGKLGDEARQRAYREKLPGVKADG